MTTKLKAHGKPAVPLPAGTLVLLGEGEGRGAMGISVRGLEGMIASGRYPKPDNKVGALSRWRLDTHNAWYERTFPRTAGRPDAA